MTDSGNGDDLWANTRPEGAPQSDPPPSDPDATPAGGFPSTGGAGTGPVLPPAGGAAADPTMIQPIVAGGAGAGFGTPPPAPPGPPGGGLPPDDGVPAGGPPPWLLPLAIGLVVLLVIVLGFILVNNNNDDGTTITSTLPATETTLEALPTSSGPDTTLSPDTTIGDTTLPDTSTTSTTTTTLPATTTTTSTTTTVPDPLPDPGFATIDGATVPIEAACSVVSFAPASGDREDTGYLMTTVASRVQVDRYVDSGNAGADLLFIDTGRRATSTSFTPVGAGFVATMDGQGGSFEIALNPPAGGVSPCANVVKTSTSDLDDFPFNQGVLDLCTGPGPGGTDVYVATLTEQGRVLAVDQLDGTADIQYSLDGAIDRFEGFGPWTGGAFEGTLENSGGDTLLFRSNFDLASARPCDPNEIF